MDKLKRFFKSIWEKLSLVFKKPSMKNLIGQIENCLRTHVLISFKTSRVESFSSSNDEKCFTIKFIISILKHDNFSLSIDFNNIDDIKYEYDIKTSDDDMFQILTQFADNLSKSKMDINGWIRKYDSKTR